MTNPAKPYGLLAEFKDAPALCEAIRRTRAEGYRQIEAYTPFPVEAVEEALELPQTRFPLVVLTGGIIGGICGYLLQFWVATIAYPLNVGGRPYHSWPMFLPITFEMTVLGAALSAVFGMLALNGLPMPYHPLFNVERFGLASRSRFFLSVQSRDPKFDLEPTRAFLASLEPRRVLEVPA